MFEVLISLFMERFQIVTPATKMNFMTDSEKTTHEWVTLLSAAIKGLSGV